MAHGSLARGHMLFRSIARGVLVSATSALFLSACVGVTEDAFVDDGHGDAAVDTLTPTNDAGSDASPEASDAASDTAVHVEDANVDTRTSTDTAAPADAPTTGGGYPVLIVGKITGAESTEPTMIADGVKLANDTMKTSCFRDFVLSASWTETSGLSQAQIYDKLCSGPITVDVDMYLGTWYENHVSRTIGYEKEPGTVHMNRYYVNTAYMVADNLIHEGEGHSQGFRHDGVKATSVPYGLNDAFEACSPVKP